MTCRACAGADAWCCRSGRIPVTERDERRAPGVLVAGDMPLRADGSCSHLAADDSCSIYEVRPTACRAQDPAVCIRAQAARL